jgi:Domain of unknown function (DUF4286)
MIIYEVTTDVPATVVLQYEAFMRERHIPDVLATGCFVNATIYSSIPGRYRVRYVTRTLDMLDHYLRTYAPQLRSDFAKHLGEAVSVSREVWSELQHFSAPDRVPS